MKKAKTFEQKIEQLKVFNCYVEPSENGLKFKDETPLHIRKQFAKWLHKFKPHWQEN